MGEPRLVPAVAPDGTPIMVPESGVAALEDSRGRAISPGEMAAEQSRIAKRDRPFDPIEAEFAGQFGYGRGVAEAFGIPLDYVAPKVASLFGDEAEKATREYIKTSKEAYPTLSGFTGLLGNVGGAVGAAELLGLPGGVTTPWVGGARGVATRMATGGVENVVQATTKDINEASLGDTTINGEKLLADLPKHFIMGAALTGAAEGGIAAVGAGARALSKKAPALEAKAWDMAARDAETTGETLKGIAERQGAGLPKSAPGLASMLEAEQGAVRTAQAAEHASKAEALAGEHAAERTSFDALRGSRRAEVAAGGVAGVGRAEAEGAESVLDAMARGGERVEAAELAAGARVRQAGGQAFETNMAAARAAEAEGGAALHGEMSAARRGVDDVTFKYDVLRKTLQEERAAATRGVESIAAQREATAKELAEAAKGVRERGHVPPGKITPEEFDNMLDTYVGLTGRKSDPATRWAAEEHLRKLYGQDIVEMAEVSGQASGGHVQRLEAMAGELEKAHKSALAEVGKIDKAASALEKSYAADVRAAETSADRRVVDFQRATTKESKKAGQAADAALANLRKTEEATQKVVEVARTKGLGEAAAAEKVAERQVAAARANADKELAKFDKLVASEEAAMGRTQGQAVRALGEAPTTTPVDPMLTAVQGQVKARAGAPLVAESAGLGAVISLVHGNPFGAAAALASSFAAGRVRAQGNYLAARTLKGLADQLTKFDQALASGAAHVLADRGAVAASNVRPSKLPPFEKVVKNVRDAQSNPTLVERHVQASAPWAKEAPMLYAGTLSTALRAQDFLFSKLPPEQKDRNSLTPHLLDVAISDTAKYDFMQYVKTIADPLDVFRDVKDGSVTDAQVEALSAVYPGLYSQMKAEVMRDVSMRTEPIPYEREIHLGTLLGLPTNEVLDRDFQKALQTSYEQKAEEAAPMPGSKKSGGGGSGQNMLSTAQRVEGGNY